MLQEYLAQDQLLPSLWSQIRLLVVLCALFTVPGLALLTLSRVGTTWRQFERFLLAIGISISVYPILFYAARLLAPAVTLGPLFIGGLLLLSLVIIGRAATRRTWRVEALAWYEWAALGLLLLIAASRLWVAYQYPFPAWTDSLHHAMIVSMTVENGYLPYDLNPIFDIPLDVYHLGLYSIGACAAWLAQVPAHLALQWSAQLLNACTGLGIYLILVRMAGPTGALAGLAYVGLLSHQPAYYVNWGRFTQLASQVVIPMAWLVTVESISRWRSNMPEAEPALPIAKAESGSPPTNGRWLLWHGIIAGMLTGAVFLFHFRVAIFYILLLVLTLVWLYWRGIREQRAWATFQATLTVGLFSTFFILPSLWEILYNYYATYVLPNQMDFPELVDPELIDQFVTNYYNFSLDTVPILAARMPWLAVTALLGLVGLLLGNRLTNLNLFWIILLYGIGSAYMLGIKGLSVTNMGAVLIMLYIPFSLIIGSGVEEIIKRISWQPQPWVRGALAAVMVAATIPFAQQRAQELEPARFFVSASDLQAMQWIAVNVPPEERIAVKSTFWLPLGPHGIDGGYWIPYFTGHQTTAGTMLTAVSLNEHHRETVILSQIVKSLETDPQALFQLLEQNVEYIYLGSSGFQHLSALTVDALLATGQAQIVFQNEGVTILRISREIIVQTATAPA